MEEFAKLLKPYCSHDSNCYLQFAIITTYHTVICPPRQLPGNVYLFLSLFFRYISLFTELSLENVACGKPTAIQTTTLVAYRMWGNKDNVVAGDKSASSSGSGCSACFASNPVQGYWQVDLDANFYLSYVEITGVQGEWSSNPNGSDFKITLSDWPFVKPCKPWWKIGKRVNSPRQFS